MCDKSGRNQYAQSRYRACMVTDLLSCCHLMMRSWEWLRNLRPLHGLKWLLEREPLNLRSSLWGPLARNCSWCFLRPIGLILVVWPHLALKEAGKCNLYSGKPHVLLKTLKLFSYRRRGGWLLGASSQLLAPFNGCGASEKLRWAQCYVAYKELNLQNLL